MYRSVFLFEIQKISYDRLGYKFKGETASMNAAWINRLTDCQDKIFQ